MPAERLNLTGSTKRMEQGASYWMDITWKDADGLVIDLSSGWTADLHIRKKISSTTALVEIDSYSEGGITLTAGVAEPNIQIHFTPIKTAGLTHESAVYDLELTNSLADVYRVLEGEIEVSLNVTR